jgi:uncharacterized protein
VTLPFLDTNVLLRHLCQDHPDHSPRATALLERIEAKSLCVRISDIVIAETVFTLQRTYKIPKAQIAQALLDIIGLPAVSVTNKRRFRAVFDLYTTQNIPYPDAYQIVQMGAARSTQIYSFDDDFDGIAGITRTEP